MIDNYTYFLKIGLIFITAELIPGQDFMLVMRNNLIGNRKIGFYTSIGIGLGVIFHSSYILFILSYIKEYSSLVIEIIRYFGASFLIYLGISSITKLNTKFDISEKNTTDSKSSYLTPMRGFYTGVISSVLNPFSIIFFTSTLGLAADLNSSFYIKMLIILEAFVICITWLFFISIIFSSNFLKTVLLKNLGNWISKIAGGFLIIIALIMLFR